MLAGPCLSLFVQIITFPTQLFAAPQALSNDVDKIQQNADVEDA